MNINSIIKKYAPKWFNLSQISKTPLGCKFDCELNANINEQYNIIGEWNLKYCFNFILKCI